VTKEQLQAENERLGREVAALRDLLTAVRDHADVPRPADYDNPAYRWLCADRLIDIAIWAELNEHATGPNADRHLNDWAARLRERAARPLKYTVRAAEPEPAADGPGGVPLPADCDQANPETGAHCHRGGDHGVHEDTDGVQWRTDTVGGLLLPADCDPDSAPARVEDIPDEMFGSPSSGLGYRS
jgi:hypothetical protein